MNFPNEGIPSGEITHQEAVQMLMAERYVLGELDGTEREKFEEHLFGCVDCARDVRDLDSLAQGIAYTGANLPQGVPERTASLWQRLAEWWAQPQVGMAAAMAMVALTVTVGIQSTRPSGMAPGVVESYLLRPETRGVAASLVLPSAGPLLLEADVPGMSGRLQYRLADAAGKVLLEGTATAPVAGATFKLLVPGGSLAAGNYELNLTEAATGRSQIFSFSLRKN
ncbi:MAG: zf-HC2 domain-containing protein [Bryobacter sp.]|nr:zf-HC2 domain-containing protein [Bryobacter sp.]